MKYEIVGPGPFLHLAIAVENRRLEAGNGMVLPSGCGLCHLRSGLLGLATLIGREARFCRQGQALLFSESGSAILDAPSLVAKADSYATIIVFDRDPWSAVNRRFGGAFDFEDFNSPWKRAPRLVAPPEILRHQIEGFCALVDLATKADDSRERGGDATTREYLLASSVAQLCLLLAAEAARPGGGGDDREAILTIEEMVAWIDVHYDEHFSLDETASRCAMNTSDFSRGFKSVAGSPLFEYLNRCRITRAALLLKNGDLSVTEVALSVGYNNLSFFNRYFLRLMGTTPTEYRRRHS